MFFPINSAGSPYPSIRAAEGFEKIQVPSESQPQIASVAESRIRRILSSLLCRASSACVRVVLSSESGMVECAGPAPEHEDLSGQIPISETHKQRIGIARKCNLHSALTIRRHGLLQIDVAERNRALLPAHVDGDGLIAKNIVITLDMLPVL